MPRGDYSKLTEQQRAEIIRRYETTLPDGSHEGTTAIAKDLGLPLGAVKYTLIKAGVRIRNAAESHAGGRGGRPVTHLPRGKQPSCKCGCEGLVPWNQRRDEWYTYIPGHYRQSALYKNESWLREQVVTQNRAITDIASECGVSKTTIRKFVVKFSLDGSEPVVKQPQVPWNKGLVFSYNYGARHVRVMKNRGKASAYLCEGCCGRRALDWATIHGRSGRELFTDYVPLCRSCHMSYDYLETGTRRR